MPKTGLLFQSDNQVVDSDAFVIGKSLVIPKKPIRKETDKGEYLSS